MAASFPPTGTVELRDAFAAAALAGILANEYLTRTAPPLTHAERAEAAYQAADAMLATRCQDLSAETPAPQQKALGSLSYDDC